MFVGQEFGGGLDAWFWLRSFLREFVTISLTELVGLLPRLRHLVPYRWAPPGGGSSLPEEYMLHRREQDRITSVSIAHL